jgi:hypothetical protein
LEIDPSCSGSCLACHKTHEKTEVSVCIETDTSKREEKGALGREKPSANVVQRYRGHEEAQIEAIDPIKSRGSVLEAGKALLNKFLVRNHNKNRETGV